MSNPNMRAMMIGNALQGVGNAMSGLSAAQRGYPGRQFNARQSQAFDPLRMMQMQMMAQKYEDETGAAKRKASLFDSLTPGEGLLKGVSEPAARYMMETGALGDFIAKRAGTAPSKFERWLGYSPEQRRAYADYQNVGKTGPAPSQWDIYKGLSEEQRALYDRMRGRGDAKETAPAYKNVIYPDGSKGLVNTKDMNAMAEVQAKGGQLYSTVSPNGIFQPMQPTEDAPETPSILPPDTDLSEATGGEGWLKGLLNTGLGVVGEQPYPGAENAANAISDLGVQTLAALRVAIPGRENRAIDQMIEKTNVEPGSLTMGGPRVLSRLEQRKRFVDAEIARMENDILSRPGAFSATEVSQTRVNLSQLKTLRSAYDEAITNMKENPSDVSADSFKPESPGGHSQADLEYTAKKHGISVEEVKRRLGIQ